MIEAPKVLLALAAAGMIAAAPGTALAVPSYGGVVSVGGADGGPNNDDGIYFGTGNVDGNFTIDTANNVEVALRAKDRATLQTIDGSSGVYHAKPGLCNPVCSGGAKAAWNYEFSVNLQAGGGGLTFSDVLVVIELDTDNSAGVSFTTRNVLNNWPDNAYWDGDKREASTPVAGEYGVQQSANPLFGDSGFMPGFNPFVQGLYDIRLSVYERLANDEQGTLLAQTDIQVQVPEPASALLLSLGLLGLGFARRKLA